MGAVNAGTGDFSGRLNLPTFTTGNYPAGNEGDMIYDSTLGSIFIFNGQSWVPPGFGRKPVATGGDSLQNIGGYQHHFFYSSGTCFLSSLFVGNGQTRAHLSTALWSKLSMKSL